MPNLAPVKYANCYETVGGPIRLIEESSIKIGGLMHSVANASLDGPFRMKTGSGVVFASVDGTGIDIDPIQARYKAISEAIERWAFGVAHLSDAKEKYGFLMDHTSNGMAAFPGLFSRQTRSFALREAVERFSLVAWWNEETGIKELGQDSKGLEVFEILQPFRKHKVVLLRRIKANDYNVFSYGCGSDLDSAKQSALFELERSDILLESFYGRNSGFEWEDLSTIESFVERRLIAFSLPEGLELFEAKVEKTKDLNTIAKPKVLVDRQIPGPWSKYAFVWRVLFDMPSDDYLNPEELTFYF